MMSLFTKRVLSFLILTGLIISSAPPMLPRVYAQEAGGSFDAESLGLVLGGLIVGDAAIKLFCVGYAETANMLKDILADGKEKLIEMGWDWLKDETDVDDLVEDFLSGEVPVRAKGVEKEEKESRKVGIAERCDNFLSKVLLARIKKRLLDSLVDETIRWIQGKGDPRFITNTNRFLDDAFQAAVGDTILGLDLANLCYQPSKFRLRVELMQPVFSQRVSCTLDSVVKNIGAFKNDFKTGGWIAYQESLKLQNTLAGISILTQDELLRKQNSKSEIARYEATVGAGFLGQKRCNLWQATAASVYYVPEFNNEGEMIGTLSDTDVEVGATISQAGGFIYHVYSPDLVPYSGKTDRPLGSGWTCTQPEIITPGQIVGEAAAKAVGSDLEFIMSADDLTQYVSAMVNAVINRLTKEATKGLSGIFVFDDKGKNIDRRNDYGTTTPGDNSLETSKQQILASISTFSTILGSAVDILLIASSTNVELITTLEGLITCQAPLIEPIDSNAETTLGEALERVVTIDEMVSESESYATRLSSLPEDINGATNYTALSALSAEISALTTTINNFEDVAQSVKDTTETLFNSANSNLQTCEDG